MSNLIENTKYWMIRSGRSSHLIDDFLDYNIISIGWNDIGEIKENTSYEELKLIIANSYPDYSQGKINQTTGQIWRFFNEFNFLDNVISYDSNTRLYYLGKITSDYSYDTKYKYAHYRKVQWDYQPIERDLLPTDIKNLLGSILTIFEIPTASWNEIIKHHPGFISEEDLKELEELHKKNEQEDLDQLKLDIISKSTEFIKDIISNLSWENTEKLVEGIIETLGYKTRMTSRGSDLGSDIFASPDGLGMLDPRIKIEVKKRTKDKIGAPDLRNFIGGMRGHDRGIYVTTTGFTKEALYEAERCNFVITLVDLELLVNLLTENYEKLKPEMKALVPLKQIYWPI